MTWLSSSSRRASVVAMNPAPPVMKMRLPCKATVEHSSLRPVQGELQAWLATAAGPDDEFVDRAWQLVVRRSAGAGGARRGAPQARRRDALSCGAAAPAHLERRSSSAWRCSTTRCRSPPPSAPARARCGAPPGPAGCTRRASDERAIEVPWCLARYDGEQRVLDVGYAFAEPAYLAGLVALGAADLTGVDLARGRRPGPAARRRRRAGAALRRIARSTSSSASRRSSTSARQHGVRRHRSREEDGDEAALRELRRVLTRKGRLLVSVPTGCATTRAGSFSARRRTGSTCSSAPASSCSRTSCTCSVPDGWRTATLAEAQAAQLRGERCRRGALSRSFGPRASSERLRLTVRDARHGDAPRRSTQ